MDLVERIAALLVNNAAAEWPLYGLIGAALGLGVVADVVRRRDLAERYLSPGFRTDLVYALLDLTHAAHFLVLVPLAALLSAFLTANAPWLRIEALAGLPGWAQFLALFVFTDFYAYWYHRGQHANAYLWQFHKVHHSQVQLTSLTVFRMSILDRVMSLVALSVPAAMMATSYAIPVMVVMLVQLHQALLHSNTGWSFGPLGRLFVSPAFHELHHSADRAQGNSNYGPALVVWDRLFGTAAPAGAVALRHGLDDEIVPESFLRQIFVPAVGVWRQLRRDLAPGRPAATVEASLPA